MHRDPAIPQQEPSEAETGVVARLVAYAPGRFVALPPHTTLEVVERPQPVAVPGAAPHGYGLLGWQDQRLPMIDLQALLAAVPQRDSLPLPRYALVVAYQDPSSAAVRHGAIGMAELPESVLVGDAAFCDLPDDSPLWPVISLSCFRRGDRAVPVIDTGRLFGSCHA